MISWLWQLPQHLLALALMALYKPKLTEEYKGCTVCWVGAEWGVSLGRYILLSEDYRDDDNVIGHEHGHSLQSKILGWLYLPMVGLPSITMNLLSLFLLAIGRPRFSENYYHRWPESWADRLGGVSRRSFR